jgi:germination protein M
MTRRRIVLLLLGVLGLAALGFGLTIALERVMRPAPPPAVQNAAPAAQPAPVRHITATLYYGSPDAQRLVAVKREVPLGEGTVEQGRQIVLAQLTLAAAPPNLSVVPPGATLRSFYITDKGEAFVDLGREIVTAHRGGSAAELLTVYAIVNAVATNLSAVTRVQLLVDGREVDTLAGHVDIRRPLQRNDAMMQESN